MGDERVLNPEFFYQSFKFAGRCLFTIPFPALCHKFFI